MRKKEIYKPIKVQIPVDFSVYVADGIEYKKAEIILDHFEHHVKLYLKHQRDIFDKFMLMEAEDLKEAFKTK